MKKKNLFLFLLTPLLLGSCDLSSTLDYVMSFINKPVNPVIDEKDNDNDGEEHHDDHTDDKEDDNDDGGNTGTGGGTTTDEDDNEDYKPDNKKLSLDDYTTFKFHDGREPQYNEYFTFYYGDSLEPNGCLWENPNEKSECSGVEFKKNCFMVSPLFNSWNKLEIRLNFWFTLHQSSKYEATKNEPQFKLEMYNDSSKLINTVNIEIKESDVPKNNTTKEVRTYVYEPTASYFVLRWNNNVPHSQGGYGEILVDATLKGWPYSN